MPQNRLNGFPRDAQAVKVGAEPAAESMPAVPFNSSFAECRFDGAIQNIVEAKWRAIDGAKDRTSDWIPFPLPVSV
jgi:hypothetical protein